MEKGIRIVIADAGSTKTTWVLLADEGERRLTGCGLNPYALNDDEIRAALREDVGAEEWTAPAAVYFYGAGCRGEGAERMRVLLAAHLRAREEDVHVCSDLVGAKFALLGDADGIACILGTGANSGLFVDGELVQSISPLGYILGDEGSGAVLGRRMLADYLKGQMPSHLLENFREMYPHASIDEALRRTYREEAANRYLASFAPFAIENRKEQSVRDVILEEFNLFFKRNIRPYARPELPVCFVGSIAFLLRVELLQAAASQGFRLGRVVRDPMDGLVAYHSCHV